MNISEDFKPVPTRAALAAQKKLANCEFKAMVFQEPQYHQSKSTSMPDKQQNKSRDEAVQKRPHKSDKDSADTNPEFDIKKARHEVLNFAMSNQRVTKNKRKMEIFQLIKLGAKPPKKTAKNYKELKDERQRLKNIREERKKFHQLGKNQTGAASVKCRSKNNEERKQKKRAPVSNIDQHYGKAQPKFKKRK
ncbi:uncharacterized protein C1orf131 [Drosophila guanche]|uniref:Blast:Uncharacterized protein C1orf131 n=1 Tax=Drosophila guanche TaxID=7266 RepID=A0A3B0KJW9_DROGU|nr:uncharacterized protein C1orf131 [Drosophila guanche]SPP86789.1 blast:Uncharacterized protein C1orf131 [Drosophila guanche]